MEHPWISGPAIRALPAGKGKGEANATARDDFDDLAGLVTGGEPKSSDSRLGSWRSSLCSQYLWTPLSNWAAMCAHLGYMVVDSGQMQFGDG
jgi:hypothetical protein